MADVVAPLGSAGATGSPDEGGPAGVAGVVSDASVGAGTGPDVAKGLGDGVEVGSVVAIGLEADAFGVGVVSTG
ncbi:hypothetical protein [Streptomyces sp. NPDC059957]|uniref:hypothetical protein n=1 Tax=Streptomyces sp. NPDC059957 TaxID=3347016 RepID=UPI00364C1E47